MYSTNCLSQECDTAKYLLNDRQIRRVMQKVNVEIKSKYCISKHKSENNDKCIIQGVLLDRISGAPIVGANVYLSNDNGIPTDNNGLFKLEVEEGKHTLKFQSIGYSDFAIKRIKIEKSEIIKIVIFYGKSWIR